jgi:uncharacterized protein DUF4340
MKSRGLLVATIILAALGGTLYWSNHRKPEDTTTKAAADAPPKILALNQPDISRVEIKKKGGEEIMLTKNDTGKWQISAPKALPADQNTVSNMLSPLSTLNAERLIEDKASNLEQYGLTHPAIEVEITQKDAKKYELLFGDDTPTGSGTFTALGGDPRVFTVATYNKNGFDKSADDLRDKRLMTFDTDKVSRVELTAKKQTIEFGRNKDEWQIVKPGPYRAEGYQVDALVRNLGDAKMEVGGTEDAKKVAAAFASGTQIATAKLTDVSGTQELQLRKNKDDYYAKSSAIEGIYKVSSGLGTQLDKSLDDFRNKKLFDFGFSDPERIEMHDGAKTYSLVRSSEDWTLNGAKTDAGPARDLVGKIRDLSADKFVESGLTARVLDITVTSNDGKRVEKVLFSKNGDRIIAKRENEPALYELSSANIEELQKIAADLKPNAPTKK